MGLLALGVVVTVLLRYVFGVSFAWAEELLTMVFIATTFFGAALGLREGEHIAISLFPPKKPILQKALSILVMLVVIVVSAFVFKYSRVWISKVGGVPSPATGIVSGVFYQFVPISFAITIFYAAVQILSQFVEIRLPATKSVFQDFSELGGGEGRGS